jgi:tRNA(Ile)-lysidine synthase
MPLLEGLQQFNIRHTLWRPDTRLVASLSGGSDSLAMLLLLHDLHVVGELRLAAVAHLNHGIRPEAGEDEEFCRQVAARLGLPFVAARADVPGLARQTRRSIELAGRVARREFLDRVRREHAADVIATAHTADDQAETVILRLLRGAGPRGLSGIAPRRDRRIRPVLFATRLDLQDELRARGERWREDSTNAELTTARNRIRHELLPYLAQHLNPAAGRALARAADIARAEHDLLERQAAAAAIGVVHGAGDGVRIEVESLLLLPEALARRVLQYALAAAGEPSPTLADVDVVIGVAAGASRAADLSRVRAEHFGRFVVLVRRTSPGRAAPFRYALPVPGTLQADAGWTIEAQGYDRPQRLGRDPDVAQIDALAAGRVLTVRNRRPGDRLRPAGLGGTKKVQDILVDRKVSRDLRDSVPIVTDAADRIVWVAGHALDEEFRVTEGTKAVIILKLRRN